MTLFLSFRNDRPLKMLPFWRWTQAFCLLCAGLAATPACAVGEQTEFDVILTGFGENKVGVIKTVRALTGLDQKDAGVALSEDTAPLILAGDATAAASIDSCIRQHGIAPDAITATIDPQVPLLFAGQTSLPITKIEIGAPIDDAALKSDAARWIEVSSYTFGATPSAADNLVFFRGGYTGNDQGRDSTSMASLYDEPLFSCLNNALAKDQDELVIKSSRTPKALSLLALVGLGSRYSFEGSTPASPGKFNYWDLVAAFLVSLGDDQPPVIVTLSKRANAARQMALEKSQLGCLIADCLQ